MMTPDRNTWATPQGVVDAVARFMGSAPAVDLCASSENAKAPIWIGVSQGGPLESVDPRELAHLAAGGSWAWCNPPYSAAAILSVCEHLAKIVVAGGTIALLVNVDESTRWYAAIRPHVRARLSIATRIQFIPPPGVAPSSNSRSQAVYILGPARPWDPSGYPTYTLDWPLPV